VAAARDSGGINPIFSGASLESKGTTLLGLAKQVA
jgi:hypothetical protein